MEHNYRKLSNRRRSRYDLVLEYIGGEGGDMIDPSFVPSVSPQKRRQMYVYLMLQTAEWWSMSLAGNRPRIQLTTQYQELERFRNHFQVGVNNLLREIRVEKSIQAVLQDAFFDIGVARVYLGDSVEVEVEEGLLMDPGLPYVDSINTDNWVVDLTAEKWWEVNFEADWCRLPLDRLKEDPRFDRAVIKQLEPSKLRMSGPQGDPLVRSLSWAGEEDLDEPYRMVDLVNVWLPRENAIAIFPTTSDFKFASETPPLAVIPWDGPETGPYKHLTFHDVPYNLLPIAPAKTLLPLSKLANSLWRKMTAQAERQKDVTIVEPGAESDGRRIKNAKDGDMITVVNKDRVGVLSFGGANPMNQQMYLAAKGEFDRMAGNLQAKMSLGPQAATLGQEQLIYAGVGKQEAKMLAHVAGFIEDVVRDLAHLMWVDEALEVPGSFTIDGTDIKVQSNWTPEDREGNFLDYNFDVDVYSLPRRQPEEMFAQLQGLTEFALKYQDAVAAEGGMVSMQEFFRKASEFLNIPDIRRIIKFDQPPSEPDVPATPDPRKPAETTRNYVRRNVPTGGTPENQSQTMQQTLMGMAGGNPSLNSQQTAAAMQ
jgi:hypothetical protein